MAETDLTFYYAPRSRAGIAFWMFEELGVPYAMEKFSLKKGEHKSSAFLSINPMGKVPTIRHGETVVTEAAAICCYLADAFPEAGLAPAIGDRRRGTYLRWMFFSPSCIEPAIAAKAFKLPDLPPSAVGYGDFDTVINAATTAIADREYILGDQFSAADVVFGSTLRYGMRFGIIPKLPEFAAYADRLAQRPALQRVEALDEEYAREVGDA
jgi:glutathione S-transferase